MFYLFLNAKSRFDSSWGRELILRDSCDIAKRQFYDIPAPFIEWFFASIFFSIDFTMDYIDFVLPECLHTKI